ncbi:MAG: transcriptional regulator [Ignavibacteriaceae bacterium]|jgi:DNA-binding MarR family transcriptional regulator|nr:transcriptional regulator [Ignavibacteriaceae bacterium]
MQFDHKNIDEILHSRLRLAILAILSSVDEIDFTSLCKEVNTTNGNLSAHLKKLENINYISIEKRFVDKKPLTTCKVTENGLKAFQAYLDMVEQLIKQKR